MDPSRLLDGLDPAQRSAVTSSAQPLAILAGAGSGKTRVLTRRIGYRCLTGSADARHVLAVTFTRKAAGELDTRLRAFGLRDLPAAGTFHALAYAQLRSAWAASGQSAPTLLDRKGKVLGRILGNTKRVAPRDLAAEIEWAKARLVPPDGYARAAVRADRPLPVDPDRMAGWYARYEEEKRKRGLVDFDDLLSRCADLLDADPTFAAAQRWRFRHLFVDEYQDVNPLQERLLRAWLGDRPDLCVVGDPNQAIYRWNGADARYLTHFADHHPGAEVVELRCSYRSTPQILDVAASVLAGGPARARPLQAQRADGERPVVVGYRSDEDEARGIARSIRDLHRPGRPWSAQAVLVRTNGQATLIEEALRRATIPARVRGGSRLLDELPVRDLLNRYDRIRDPLVTTLTDLEALVAREREEMVEGHELELPDTASGRRIESYEQVIRLGRELLAADPAARTDGLSGWLRTVLLDDGPDAADAVTIATFHAAKGLEWDAVHVAGLEAGYLPISHARTPEARLEEQRLLYVAVTRATDVLRCSWAATRTFGADPVDRVPSPFLPWVQDAIALQERADRPTASIGATSAAAEARAAIARSRPSRPDLDRPDPQARHDAVAAGLRAWRAEQARRVSVAPTVVLSERAVEAIASRCPGSLDELAELPGLGPLVRQEHGSRLLEIVQAS